MPVGSPQKSSIIVHYHIYKAGGSTIINELARHFGQDRVLEIDKDPAFANEKIYNRAFFERLAETHPTIKVFSAHRIVPDIHFSDRLDVFPITFLRHPLLRSNSAYRYARREKAFLPHKEMALRHDFADWLAWCLDSGETAESRNFQSCILSLNNDGVFVRDLGSAERRGNLSLVYKRLDAMPVVGIVETYQRSIDAINQAAQHLFPGLRILNSQENVTKFVNDWQLELKAVEGTLPRSLVERFYGANADDLTLFERYRARLEEQQ